MLEFYPFPKNPEFFLPPAAIARLCGTTVHPYDDEEYGSEENESERDEESDSDAESGEDNVESAPRCSISKISKGEWHGVLSAIFAYIDNSDGGQQTEEKKDWVLSFDHSYSYEIHVFFVVFVLPLLSAVCCRLYVVGCMLSAVCCRLNWK